MGRKKIQISRIGDERNRQVTFTKRKFGLMKKAYELSVLCDCEIALIIFNSSNKLFQYASTDMDKVLLKYTEYNEPHESRTNKDIVEMLRKKEFKGGDSPDEYGALSKKDKSGLESPDDSNDCYGLTPRTEEKYQRINQEFEEMIKRNSRIAPNIQNLQNYQHPMQVSVPVNPGSDYPSPQQQSSSSAMSLAPPQQNIPSHSPRPSSAGEMIDLSSGGGGHQNGYPSSVSPHMNNSKQSPNQARPNLRVVIPSNRNDIVNQLVRGATTGLHTPSLSQATPSNPAANSSFVSGGLSSVYPSEFHLNTGDLQSLAGFNTPGGLSGQWSSSQAGPLTAAIQAVGGINPINSAALSMMGQNHGINTSSSNTTSHLANSLHAHSSSIKSEPASPQQRETHTPQSSSHLRPPGQGGAHSPSHHLSHPHSLSPNTLNTHHQGATSPGLQDKDMGPGGKRLRMQSDGWNPT